MTDHSPSLIHHLDAVEAAAFREIYAAAPNGIAASLGLETRNVAGATLLIAPGIPTSMFNRVIGLGNTQAATEADLSQIAEHYRRAGVKTWWIHLSPGAQPITLIDLLTAHGFVPPPRKTWAKVLRGTELPPMVETGLEVRPLRAGEELALAHTICAAFDMPDAWAPWFARAATQNGWRAVAAFDGIKLVGGGLLFILDNTAWLGAGGVRPEARRHHAHRALMGLRIELAIAAGCKYITTETGEAIGDEPNPSLRNMHACGFTKIYSRHNFAAPEAPAAR
jgi:GNAT superfamily N-acetyltransferase